MKTLLKKNILRVFAVCLLAVSLFIGAAKAAEPKPVLTLCAILDEYQKKGWNVPKLVHYTNSASGQTMQRIYDNFYKNFFDFNSFNSYPSYIFWNFRFCL